MASRVGDALSDNFGRHASSADTLPDPTSAPDPLCNIDPQATLPRVAIIVHETSPATPLHAPVVAHKLHSMLSMRGFEVEVLTLDEPSSDAPSDPQPPAEIVNRIRRRDDLQAFDVIMIGRASCHPGIRTGALITAEAHLSLTLYDALTGEPLTAVEMVRHALEASADSATHQALRLVARASLEPLLVGLLEIKP